MQLIHQPNLCETYIYLFVLPVNFECKSGGTLKKGNCRKVYLQLSDCLFIAAQWYIASREPGNEAKL